MLNMLKAGAVVFAKDVNKVACFYELLLAMSVVHAESEKVVLESEEMLLVIHGIPKAIGEGIVITDPPEIREETPIKLFFPVRSLAEARANAPRWGGRVNPPSQEWTAGNFRACDGFDPEGNVVQFRELI